MTNVDKLGIRGIRCFDPDRLETVKFERPLTLIVGPNGSGKTTIIECLKMATTGEMPPNCNKGQSFIHDPKLTGAAEVKAQIRLLFKTAQNKKICAMRSFQLTNTKDRESRFKQTFKQLEAVLQTQTSEGKTASVSHKCAEMDLLVPQLMGVSKPILENVVFCHQEDSTWPLQDQAKLKKKFDDLFGATRYTKALVAIQQQKTAHSAKVKELSASVALLEAHLLQSNKLKESLQNSQTQIDSLDEKIAQTETRHDSLKREIKEEESRLQEFESFFSKLDFFTHSLQSLQNDCSAIRSSLKDELLESLQELEAYLSDFDLQKLPALQRKKEEAQAAHSSSKDEEKKARQALEDCRRACGDVAGNLDALALKRARIVERGNRILAYIRLNMKEDVPDLKIDGENSSVTNMSTFLTSSRKVLVNSNRELETIKDQTEKIELEHNRRVEAAESTVISIESLAAGLNAQKLEITNTIKKLNHELSMLRNSQNTQEALMLSLKQARANVTNLENSSSLKDIDSKLRDLDISRARLRKEIQESEDILRSLESQSKLSIDVEVMRRDVISQEVEVREKRLTLLAELTKLVSDTSSNSPPNNVNSTIVDELLREASLAAECSRKHSHKVRDSATASRIRMELGKQEVDRMDSRIQELRMASTGHSESENMHASRISKLSAELETAKSTHAQALRTLTVLEGAEDLHKRYFSKSEKDSSCLFCGRPFNGAGEVDAMRLLVDKRLGLFANEFVKLKDRVSVATASLSVAEKSYLTAEREAAVAVAANNGAGANDSVVERQRLTQNLMEANDRISAAKSEFDRYSSESRTAENELKNAENRVSSLNMLRAQVASYEKLLAALDDMQGRLKSAESKLHASSGGKETKTLQEVRDHLSSLGRKRDEIASEEGTLNQEKRQLEQNLMSAKMQVSEMSFKLSSAEASAHRMQAVLSELKEMEARHKECMQQVDSQANLDNARANLSNIRNERRSAISHLQARIEHLRSGTRVLQDDLDGLEDLVNEETNLARLVSLAASSRDTLTRFEESFASASLKKEEAERSFEKARESCDRANQMRTSVVANMDLKRKEAEIGKMKTEMDELQRLCGGQDKTRVLQKLNLGRDQLAALVAELGILTGQRLSQVKFQSQINIELNGSPQYIGIEQKYNEAVIAFETEQLVVSDLTRYHQALDIALMRFHSKKMEDINRTIRELWMSVYRGFDIDYIAIRSSADDATDEDGNPLPAPPPGAGGTSASRSYNYRVVLVRQGVELDMRGRCSAGQKMIASIIIRLALAESFGVNCGILALDEPTTNLDKINVEGLAKALGEIIQARRCHTGFQLILITHDEEFVRQLGRMHLCENYVQVAKDANGKSHIRMADIRNF